MHPQDPDQHPFPSTGEALRRLVRRSWTWWQSLRPSVQAGLVGLVVVGLVVLGGSGAEPRGADDAGAVAGPSNARGTGPAQSPPPVQLTTGSVAEDPDRASRELDAEEYARWLEQLGDVELDGGSVSSAVDEIGRLADTYGSAAGDNRIVLSIPGKGSRVRDDLRRAAEQLQAGDKALRKSRYGDAQRAFKAATHALDDLRAHARRDLETIEQTSSLRLTRNGAVSGEVSTDFATVISWVDGDTVDTDRGRVRVLGINTPEMHEQCQPAQAAKDAASQLAPAGQRIKLVNPDSVRTTDRYGRLLRYVEVTGSGSTSSVDVVDVGYSLLLNGLAEPRYDSEDGYQWHPRESAYRATKAEPASGGACPAAGEEDAFVLATTLASSKGEDEYWRRKIVAETVARPYHSAAKNLTTYVTSVRKDDEKAERAEKVAKERVAGARRRELARQQESSSSSSDNSPDDGSTSSGDDGYTGKRCYLPGGQTYRPC